MTEDTQLDLWELLGTTRVVTDALGHRLAPAKASSREEKDRSAAALDGQVAGRREKVAAGSERPRGALRRTEEKAPLPRDAACTAGATRGLGLPAHAIGEQGPITRASGLKRRQQARR